jgi:hypothetical protein
VREITCREFDTLVHGLVRVELLDVSAREEAIEHAARCSQCADRLTEAGILAETTAAAGQADREQQTPPAVEALLLAAFRSQRRRVVMWRTIQWASTGAVAAMLALVLWNFSAPPKGLTSPAPKKDVSTQSKEPLDAKAVDASEPSDGAQGAEVVVADAGNAGAYSMADFVPVPYSDEIGPEDSGMVVRVQLTRSSLAELGYPAADTPDEDLIRADVLVGEDGWPRGVKLVQ